MQYKSLKRIWPDSLLPIWGSGLRDYPPSRVRVWPARLTILHSHSQSHGLATYIYSLAPKKGNYPPNLEQEKTAQWVPNSGNSMLAFQDKTRTYQSRSVPSSSQHFCRWAIFRMTSVVWRHIRCSFSAARRSAAAISLSALPEVHAWVVPD